MFNFTGSGLLFQHNIYLYGVVLAGVFLCSVTLDLILQYKYWRMYRPFLKNGFIFKSCHIFRYSIYSYK